VKQAPHTITAHINKKRKNVQMQAKAYETGFISQQQTPQLNRRLWNRRPTQPAPGEHREPGEQKHHDQSCSAATLICTYTPGLKSQPIRHAAHTFSTQINKKRKNVQMQAKACVTGNISQQQTPQLNRSLWNRRHTRPTPGERKRTR
jgi:hypothetical protein